MFSMQYGFDFPSNFDMNAIRARVAEIGPRFDNLPGLYHKIFLVGDRQQGIASRYSPFYLWRDLQGMTTFLESEAFVAVCAHYGRPPVQRWNSVGFIEGPALKEPPRFAVQETTFLPQDTSLARLRDAEHETLHGLAADPDVHSAYVGLDPEKWQLMRISLWRDQPRQVMGRVFDVGYLSRPQADQNS